MITKCPRCGKETGSEGNPFRPFCSEHCKLIDLGNWIFGNYRIPEEQSEETEDEDRFIQKDLNKE